MCLNLAVCTTGLEAGNSFQSSVSAAGHKASNARKQAHQRESQECALSVHRTPLLSNPATAGGCRPVWRAPQSFNGPSGSPSQASKPGAAVLLQHGVLGNSVSGDLVPPLSLLSRGLDQVRPPRSVDGSALHCRPWLHSWMSLCCRVCESHQVQLGPACARLGAVMQRAASSAL